jgi:hypothetical protein
MPNEASVPLTDSAEVTNSKAQQQHSASARSRAAAKGVATSERHKQERRAESLARMQAQIEDGTLVVRQMTTAEREAVSGAAPKTRVRA